MIEPVTNQDIDSLLKQKRTAILKKKQEEQELKAKIDQELLVRQMKDVTLGSSISEESKGGMDEVDLIIGDTSALKRIESSSS